MLLVMCIFTREAWRGADRSVVNYDSVDNTPGSFTARYAPESEPVRYRLPHTVVSRRVLQRDTLVATFQLIPTPKNASHRNCSAHSLHPCWICSCLCIIKLQKGEDVKLSSELDNWIHPWIGYLDWIGLVGWLWPSFIKISNHCNTVDAVSFKLWFMNV